mmetsp:Transcript_24085/g.58163  ORF Transcript_24085/g.58163 Transcript_24085/m.58163 type:complete len:227 (-) Transcript_24085:20-700(-)
MAMANQSNASTSTLLPAIVTISVANKPPSSGIEISRTVSSISGNNTGLRIASLDPAICYDETECDPRMGDEIVSINNVEPKNSVDTAMKLLAEAKGNNVEIKVLRTNTQAYRETLVSGRFGNEYSIKFESSNRAILRPKDNPSILKATLAPMYFTRFKYSITFDDRTGAISFEDLYAITFNRSNGATPQQQQRIQNRHHAFKDQLEKMEATMDHNRNQARKLAVDS